MAPQSRAQRAERPARRPMAAARRISLFEREIRVFLGTAGIEVLFAVARVLSEGQREGDRYFGSTMITVELSRARDLVRDELDAASAKRIAELLERDARVNARARALASEAAVARAGAPLARIELDVRARAAGSCVQLDIDVEGALR